MKLDRALLFVFFIFVLGQSALWILRIFGLLNLILPLFIVTCILVTAVLYVMAFRRRRK